MALPAAKAAAAKNVLRIRTLFNTGGAQAGARRRRYLVPALHTAKSVAHILDVPVLKQSGDVVVGFVEALRTPKGNRVEAQKQIDRIDQAIASVWTEVYSSRQDNKCQLQEWYWCEAQMFVDELGKLREKLTQAANKQHGMNHFIDQWNISETLGACNKEFNCAKSKYSEARCIWKVYVSIAQNHELESGALMPITPRRTPQPLTTRFAGDIGRLRRRNHPRLADPNGRSRPIAGLFLITGAFF